MKPIRSIAVLFCFVLLFANVAYCEAPDNADILDEFIMLPAEERYNVAIEILTILINKDGLRIAEKAYQTATTNTNPILSDPIGNDEPISAKLLDELLLAQPLAVIDVDRIEQGTRIKSLFPDMLSATIRNNTTVDVKDAVVAFVAWDKHGLPVKIESQFDFAGGSYLCTTSYDDINLIPGETFGDHYGLYLDQDSTIKSCKAIVVSYNDFDGNEWRNPYFNVFRELYEGKKLSD